MRRMLIGSVAVVLLLACANLHAAKINPTRARLSMNLPELKFTNVALSDAIDFLRDVSGANIHVNWKALEELGVGKDTPINVKLRAVSLRKILNVLVNETGVPGAITWMIDDNVIEITSRQIADQQLVTRVYPVDDLLMEIPDFEGPNFDLTAKSGGSGGSSSGSSSSILGGDSGENEEEGSTKAERAQELVELIQELIQPDIWRDNGGVATIKYFHGSLIITAPRSVHEAVGGPID
jgi:hypothetical protein